MASELLCVRQHSLCQGIVIRPALQRHKEVAVNECQLLVSSAGCRCCVVCDCACMVHQCRKHWIDRRPLVSTFLGGCFTLLFFTVLSPTRRRNESSVKIYVFRMSADELCIIEVLQRLTHTA